MQMYDFEQFKKLLVRENAAPIICCDDWVYNVGIVAINGRIAI